MQTKKLVTAALMAALACVATMLIRIPSPFKGHLNLGDCVVLVAGWTLSPLYGFLAAGVGSALADLFAGYLVYVPATFIIKGLMALVAYGGSGWFRKKQGDLTAMVLSGIGAECVMVVGYFLAAGLIYGFVPAMANILANCAQGVVCLVLGVVLMKMLQVRKVR